MQSEEDCWEIPSRFLAYVRAMLATVLTNNVDSDHNGHIVMILNNTVYTAFSTGSSPFVTPKNPGPFPITISVSSDFRTQAIGHKNENIQGCLQATQSKIIHAIDPEWLAGLHSKLLGFTHCSLYPNCNAHSPPHYGATLDNVNIQQLISTMDYAWNPTDHPTAKFKRHNKIEQQLKMFGILANSQCHLTLIKAAVKWLGTFYGANYEWEVKPKTD